MKVIPSFLLNWSSGFRAIFANSGCKRMSGAINFKHAHFKSVSSALTKDLATDIWQSYATN